MDERFGERKLENIAPDNWITKRPMERRVDNAVNTAWLANTIPKIEIVPCNGDPKEWPTFISSFREMIPDVVPSNAQRMGILKQLLTSDVRAYVAEYFISPDLYYQALEALKKRYGQPQIISRAHLRGLLNFPHIRDNDFDGISRLTRATFVQSSPCSLVATPVIYIQAWCSNKWLISCPPDFVINAVSRCTACYQIDFVI